jgi:hypothetical protein
LVTSVGALNLDARDLDILADLLADRLAERLRLDVFVGDWFTPADYHANGWAPTVEAARKRAYRLEAKGSADVRRVGRRVFLRGPSNGSKGLDRGVKLADD